MVSSLLNINLVFVCENLPVGAFKAADFKFRGRDFKETLRVGPLFQAQSHGAQIATLPNRFQVTVTNPDDLDIQCQGIVDVATTALEILGRRTVLAVGHNALAYVTDVGRAEAPFDDLVNKTKAAELLGLTSGSEPAASLVLEAKIGAETRAKVQIVRDAESQMRSVIDCNFEYSATEHGFDVVTSVANFRESVRLAEGIVARAREAYGPAVAEGAR